MSDTGAQTLTDYSTQHEQLRLRARELDIREREVALLELPATAGYPFGPATDAQWRALQAPFTGDAIGKLPKGPKIQGGNHPRCKDCGSKHPVEGYFHVDYVGHAHITERLNGVDPSWRMQRKGAIEFDQRGMAYMEVELTVLGVTREEVGCAETGLAEWPKLLYSDALTRVAMRFGLALDLWKKVRGGGEYRVPGGEPTTRRSEAQGGARGASGAGGGSRTSPSVGVLWEDLKNTASTIATDGGKAEWDDFKAEKGWARVWAEDGNKITEKRRELIEEALRVVRSIRAGEKAAAGDEPWDPLQGAGAPGDPLPGDPEDDRSPGSAGTDGDTGGGSEADALGDVESYGGGYG